MRGPSISPYRYIGDSPTGVVVDQIHCPPGEVVDLPDELAASLVDAGVFEAVKPAAPPAPKSKRQRNT